MPFGVNLLMMFFLWVLVVIGLLAVGYWVVEEVSGSPKSMSSASALEILEQRYARGEVNRKEYLEKKKDLSGAAAKARKK